MKQLSAVCFFIAVVFFSCAGDTEKATSKANHSTVDSVVFTNDSLAFSHAAVAVLPKLKNFKPEKIWYRLKKENNDTVFEAVLFYDEHTYGSILEQYMEADFPKGNYVKEYFDFDWLDTTLRAELNASKPDYKGNPDIFLGTKGKAQLWFLNKKILAKVY